MTVILNNRWDVNLDATFRVAWQREPVRISDTAMQRITASASWTSATSGDVAVILAFTVAALVGGALTLRRRTP